VLLARTVGDEVAQGGRLAAVYSRDAARRSQASAVLKEAFTVGEVRPAARPIVLGRE
jgi:thymidine phosphorylase